MKNNNVIELGVSDIRPITGEKGQKLNDLELAKQALKNIEDYESKNKQPAQINPEFKEFIQALVNECDPEIAGENAISVVDFKEKHILRTIPDYSMLAGVVK